MSDLNPLKRLYLAKLFSEKYLVKSANISQPLFLLQDLLPRKIGENKAEFRL